MSVKLLKKGPVRWIVLDNAKRANAITEKMYDDINRGLDEANEDKETFLTVMTAEGDYYSSGNDFSTKNGPFSAAEAARKDVEIGFSRWVRRLIDHEKVLIGLVNGPAMGMSATTLGLMDYVVASDSANGLMLFGERLEAAEALACGFVGKVFPKAEFKAKSEALVEQYAKLPAHSVLASKSLIRGEEWRRKMRGVAETELDTLRRMFAHPETARRIDERFNKKK